MHLIYATRSSLPPVAANALQSAHMAHAFSTLHSGPFVALYRSSYPASATASAHFDPAGLKPPSRTHTLRTFPSALDWLQLDLLSALVFFLKQPVGTVVYTRSLRFSWASITAGLTTFIELHDPLTPARTFGLRHLIKTKRLPGLVATTGRLRDDVLAALPELSPERILIAGNAGPSAAVTLSAIPLPQRGLFNVGYAGSAFRGKGIEVVLACAASLSDVTFHIIGPDADACARLGPVSKNVVFHGRLAHPETLGRLKSMDALLLPNQPSVIIRSGADIGAHTSPLKLFDYLATGVPIIASDLPVFHGILHSEENALLAPPSDTAAFQRQLNRLRENPELRFQLGSRSRDDFVAHHTWDQRTRHILDFISIRCNA